MVMRQTLVASQRALAPVQKMTALQIAQRLTRTFRPMSDLPWTQLPLSWTLLVM